MAFERKGKFKTRADTRKLNKITKVGESERISKRRINKKREGIRNKTRNIIDKEEIKQEEQK